MPPATGGGAAGQPGTDPFGDVFLVVDGWATLRDDYDDLEPLVTDLATRGLSYGVHVVADRRCAGSDFRPAIRDLFGSRLELRLGDPADSVVVNRRAGGERAGAAPGAGHHRASGLHFLAALPRLDAPAARPADLVKAVAERLDRAGRAPGPAAPAGAAVRRAGPAPRRPGWRLPIGVAEADLRPVLLDFATEPHFVVFGDAECGKSSFLRALATSIITPVHPGAGPGDPGRLPAQPAGRDRDAST